EHVFAKDAQQKLGPRDGELSPRALFSGGGVVASARQGPGFYLAAARSASARPDAGPNTQATVPKRLAGALTAQVREAFPIVRVQVDSGMEREALEARGLPLDPDRPSRIAPQQAHGICLRRGQAVGGARLVFGRRRHEGGATQALHDACAVHVPESRGTWR